VTVHETAVIRQGECTVKCTVTVIPIKSIDFMGTMLDGSPYAELKVNENEYILEKIKNISISIEY
jgi:hypothetical protein